MARSFLSYTGISVDSKIKHNNNFGLQAQGRRVKLSVKRKGKSLEQVERGILGMLPPL
jgi:hypothetical protein